ncbi:MAG: hypothetical protein ACO3YY_03025 [Phycisphaerales bacterium]
MTKSLLSILVAAVWAGSLAVLPATAAAPLASIATPTEDHLTFRSGRSWRGDVGDRVRVEFSENGVVQTLEGTLTRIEKRYLQVEGEIAGQTAVKTIFLSDIRDMTSIGAGATGGAAPESPRRGGSGDAGGARPETAPASPSRELAPSADDGVNRSAAGAEWPGVFLLPLSGTLGIGLRHQEIERIAEEADKYGPGQIIVLLIDSPGGLVIEGDKISDSINRIKKNHRVVAWIREAISGGAFTALHCDENYYMSFGALGAITMFAGQTAASGAELQAWLQRCADVAEAGGRNKYVVQAMIHAPLLVSYDRDEDTGRVTYYNTLEGEYDLSDEVNNLTLNASNALHSGYSQGTADTEEELARLMQLPEWKEAANGVGRRIHDDWQRNVEQAQEEVPKLVQRLNFKGSGTGDPAVVLGTRIQILQEILRWYDRCYPVCVYEVGLPGDPEPLKRQLEELRYQLGQMRRRN